MKFIVVLHTDDGHHHSATELDLPSCFIQISHKAAGSSP